ncbi:hypothetical protein [Nevskia ramosa]|uniref:hypothetical protein n=1 Tax=Nevskia ramosa TaxID=64002 RepID=UPI003D0CC9CB
MAVKKRAVKKTAKPKSRIPVVSIQRAASEAIARRKQQIASLAQAPNLLRPDEVAGDYDAGRGLLTTFGGNLRPLTRDDLMAFKKNVETIGKKYKGGITAKAIISRSLPIDRERANRQIRQAVPYKAKRGRLEFVTNAGPDSDQTRHFVAVELLSHPAAIGASASPKYLSKQVAEGPIKVSCDCGRWVYWYSFLATVGGYSSGASQPIFPKIKNPKLVGIACKHVLRVCQQLTTAPVVRVVEKMIETDRKAAETGVPKAVTLTAKQAAEFAARQAKEAGLKRNRITPVGAKRAADRLKKAIQTKIRTRASASNKLAAQDFADARKKVEDLFAVGVLSMRAYQDALKRINKGAA